MSFDPVEIKSKQYYVHRSYANVYYRTYIGLEDWISTNVFRGDSTRVFLASNEYAFRRRFELTDISEAYSSLEVSSLRFPFANYWPQNTGWVASKDPAANPAALVYAGVYEGTTKIRAAASELVVPVTFYFDREDDARLAYEILYFKTFNRHYYSIDVTLGDSGIYPGETQADGSVLTVPVNIDIDDLSFNPQFKEDAWLKQNRIFVITANFHLRSYALYPPEQPTYDVSVSPDGSLSDSSGNYNDGSGHYYLTDKVILNIVDPLITTHPSLLMASLEEDGSFSESSIVLESFTVPTATCTETSLIFEWHIANEIKESENVSKIEIYTNLDSSPDVLPAHTDIYAAVTTPSLSNLPYYYEAILGGYVRTSDTAIVEGKTYYYNIATHAYALTNLQPNSQYDVYIVYYTYDGKTKRIGREVSTLESTPVLENLTTPDQALIGVSW